MLRIPLVILYLLTFERNENLHCWLHSARTPSIIIVVLISLMNLAAGYHATLVFIVSKLLNDEKQNPNSGPAAFVESTVV